MLLLPATLTAKEATDTLRMLTQTMRQEAGEGDVLVDAGSLQHFDSAALAVLLEIDRLAQAWGRGFAVRSAPVKLAALAKLYGVDGLLLKTAPTVDAATPSALAQRSPVT